VPLWFVSTVQGHTGVGTETVRVTAPASSLCNQSTDSFTTVGYAVTETEILKASLHFYFFCPRLDLFLAPINQ
jgi:hypothetical protein